MKSRYNPAASRSLFWSALVAALVLSAPSGLAGVVLSWRIVDWPAGAFSQSFDVDPSNPGPDVTISLSGATNRLSPPPDDTLSMTGGFGPDEESLELHLDYASTNEFLIVTVTFHHPQGVEDVWFRLFDIDYAGSQKVDFLSEFAGTWGSNRWPGTVTTPSQPGYTVVSNGTLGLTLQGYTNTDNATSNGNAYISFGGWPLRSFSFKHRLLSTAADPPRHGIGLHEIGFAAVTAPTLRIARVPEGAQLSWDSVSNKTYQLQASGTLLTNSWQDLGPLIQGNGQPNYFTNAISGGFEFYRLEVLPLSQ